VADDKRRKAKPPKGRRGGKVERQRGTRNAERGTQEARQNVARRAPMKEQGECRMQNERQTDLRREPRSIADLGFRIALRPFDTLRVAPSVVEGREPQGPEHVRKADCGFNGERQPDVPLTLDLGLWTLDRVQACRRKSAPRPCSGRPEPVEGRFSKGGKTKSVWGSPNSPAN